MSPTFADLCDDAAFLSFETQLHLLDVLGDRRWDVDLDAGRFVFSGGTGQHRKDVVCTRMHLVGTAASGPQSWMWSWASEQGWPEEVIDLAQWLRRFGEQHGVAELAAAEVPFADLALDGPLEAGAAMLDAAKAASGRWCGYTGDAGAGTRVAFLLEHPSFALPAPVGSRVVRVLSEGLMGAGMLTDHRRAAMAYATARALPVQQKPDGGIDLSSPQGTISLSFDEQNRVAGIQAQLG